MTKILTDRQLQIKTIKAIGELSIHEKDKMVSLAHELIKNPEIPSKWRENDNNELIYFILDNRDLQKHEILIKLKQLRR